MDINKLRRIVTLVTIAIIVALIISLISVGCKYSNLAESSIKIETPISDKEKQNLSNYLTSTLTPDLLKYKDKYPDLYVDNDFRYTDDENKKICYLTFDDGPNPSVTPYILDTLKDAGIKATFFVIDSDSSSADKLYKRIVDEGHTIAIHTASHDYEKIYKSVDSYLADFDKISKRIKSVTGVKPEIFRFPGGTINVYSARIADQLSCEMVRRGYTYYDWNSSNGDAESVVTPDVDTQLAYVTADNANKKIVLMHDGANHESTADALPSIIETLKDAGYSFAPLTKDVKPITFK